MSTSLFLLCIYAAGSLVFACLYFVRRSTETWDIRIAAFVILVVFWPILGVGACLLEMNHRLRKKHGG